MGACSDHFHETRSQRRFEQVMRSCVQLQMKRWPTQHCPWSLEGKCTFQSRRHDVDEGIDFSLQSKGFQKFSFAQRQSEAQ
ncbi:unnamed protein product [Protopolystoma xenopodis]|uniref:Uncharacterized protein n=1 Tax=Protopolystoma xenopodis TaxID=117903 RepID=A0A3S5AWG8_9PLAT|nr:unnamed protein product [Protopolystoma xenopodis]